jgi:NAD+ dependent glucose-6-phosphate dehydrogenase
MNQPKTVLITGASGNLGAKLRQHLEGRYRLKLLDIDPRGDSHIIRADLSSWTRDWRDQFQGVDVIVHFAADPTAFQTWPKLIGPNLDLLVNVYQASVEAGVKRMVYASSNHVMGGYQNIAQPERITTDIPPRPGTQYVTDGQPRDSTPYGSAKLFGERLGKCFAEIHGLSVIAVRIGWVKPGDNQPVDLPLVRGPWFRLMWLSNRDFCHLMERCIEAELALPFAVINGMSANTGMRWDIEYTRKLVGYQPQDDVTRG